MSLGWLRPEGADLRGAALSPRVEGTTMRHRKRSLGVLLIVVMAIWSAASSPSSAMADTGPYATVYNSKSEAVGKWGAAYGAEPGSQIQLAENYAECGNAASCTSFPEKPKYPKVVLEPGVFHILTPYGSKHPVGGSKQPLGPWCEGVFAYAGVTLEGSKSGRTEVGNNVTQSKPCGANPSLGSLSSVIYVGANQENLAVTGTALKISSLVILSEAPSESGPRAEYGLFAANIQGAGLSVSAITENGASQSGLLIGNEAHPVIGTESSPVQVTSNVVEDSHNEGIVLEGKWMTVKSNTVTETSAHGIATYGPSSEHVEISSNTITSSSWGISLDGSESASSIGRANSVYSNTITNTCIGTILYGQVDADVAGNYVANPSTAWKPTKAGQGCPEFSETIGVAILNSCDNGVWSNRLFYVESGVRIFDGGRSPSACGGRTTANYIGRVLEIGQPWPWPVAGNWIEHPNWGFIASAASWLGDPPSNVSGNEFVGNAIDNYAQGLWYFEPGATEITSENT